MAASRCFQRVLELEPDSSQAQQEVRLTRFATRHFIRDYPRAQSLSIRVYYTCIRCKQTPFQRLLSAQEF